MIDNLLDAALEQLSPPGGISSDEDLIENLGLLSQDEPASRRAAVHALLHTRGHFWSAERVEGAIAAMTTVAAAEVDEDLAERLGALLDALFARSAQALGIPGQQTHQSALFSLLDAETAELRGFSASSLALAPGSAETIALALAREARWDVAMRMAGALIMLGEPLGEAAIVALIDAPTEEAVSVAARHIAERPFAASRPALLRRLLREPTNSPLHRPLRRALNHADAAEAYRILASSDEVEDGESLAFLNFAGRKAALKAELVQDPEREAPSLRILFSLPGELEDNRGHYARACALIASILQIPLPADQIAIGDEGASFDLSLTRDPPLVAIHALGPVLALIEETLQPFDRPSARRPELINAAMALLLERLEGLAARDGRLRAAFEGATLLRTHDGGHALCLDQAAIGDPGGPRLTFALAFDRAAIARDDPASGLILALSVADLPEIPDAEAMNRTQSALCAAIAWKTGVLVAPSTRNPALLDALGLPHGPLTFHLRGPRARPSLDDIEALIHRAARLSAFLRNLARLVTRGGVSLFELTGAPRLSSLLDPALAALTPPQEKATSAQDKRREKLEALQRKASEPPRPTATEPKVVPPLPDDEAEAQTAPQRAQTAPQTPPPATAAPPSRAASTPAIPSAIPSTSTPPLPSSRPSTPALPSTASTPALPSSSALTPAASLPSTPALPSTTSTPTLPSAPTSTPALPSSSALAPAASLASTPALPSASARSAASTPALPSASARSAASTPALPSSTASTPSLSSAPSTAPEPPSTPDLPSTPSPSRTSPSPSSSPSIPSASGSTAPGRAAGSPPASIAKASGGGNLGSGLQPLDDKGRSPTEVVRDLDADIAKVDIYLRSAGYNTAKLAQIMSILLTMEMGEARALIEKSPCILIEAIPRDRGRTIKTVLEGTGAKIAVTPHGEGLE